MYRLRAPVSDRRRCRSGCCRASWIYSPMDFGMPDGVATRPSQTAKGRGSTGFWGFVIVFIGLIWCSAPVCSEKLNVLLITVDTFRPDHLSGYGYGRKTSPELDRLMGEGVRFAQAMSSSSWTTPGLLSVLTGQFAPTHGVDVRGKSLRPGTPTMGSVLRDAGYAVPDILYLSSIPNFQNLGLTNSYAERDRFLPNGDEVLFKALEAYRDSTFFLYYHYRNLHLPYNPSPPYDRMFTPQGFGPSDFAGDRVKVIRENVTIPQGSILLETADQEWIVGLYDGQIREMDEHFFKPLRETLFQLGLYEKTLVIVTADHGEELMEHGFIGHPSTSFKGTAYDEVLHIPLSLTCPSLLPAGRVVKQQVQNVDILPTVLDLLHLPIPETVQGRSLVRLIREEEDGEKPVFAETTPGGYQATPEMMKTRIRAMRTSSWKLIHTHGPREDRYELYDLKQDPEERFEVSGQHPEVLTQMQAALHRWVLASQSRPVPEAVTGQIVAVRDPIRVLFPAHGDTFRYVDVGKAVSVRWSGPDAALYTLEYRVGKGNYHLEGSMPIQGNTSRYGPFTEEMWNMLSLYNPWAFRVSVAGTPEVTSSWVGFSILPTGSGAPPGRLALLYTSWIFVWGEAGLLFGGLGKGVVQLVQEAGEVRLLDLVTGALMLAILAGLFQAPLRQLGTERLRLWGSVVLYTGFVYATLSVMPQVWRALWGHTQGRIDFAGTGLTVLLGIGILVYFVIRRRTWLALGALVAVLGVYVYLLTVLGRSPAERFHLIEYGFLSLLVFRALSLDLPDRSALWLGWGIATALGAVDEGIQWLLPSRVFEWKDIGLNLVSCGLGMLVVALGWGKRTHTN
ncbi:MAG: VanZ family protein [bacterium]|nr:VanZ family protein [bacterium]